MMLCCYDAMMNLSSGRFLLNESNVLNCDRIISVLINVAKTKWYP